MELWTFWNRPFLESICVRYINCHVSWGCTEDVFRCKSDRKSRLFGPGNWRFGSSGATLLLSTATQCLKITKKVSFNIASKANYVCILSGQKLIKNAKCWSVMFCSTAHFLCSCTDRAASLKSYWRNFIVFFGHEYQLLMCIFIMQ